MRGVVRLLLVWMTGLVTGIFLMVGDELLSMAQYCGPSCLYPYPLLGTYTIWKAWEIAFGLIVASATMSFVLVGWRGDHS